MIKTERASFYRYENASLREEGGRAPGVRSALLRFLSMEPVALVMAYKDALWTEGRCPPRRADGLVGAREGDWLPQGEIKGAHARSTAQRVLHQEVQVEARGY